MFLNFARSVAYNADSDRTPRYAASELGLYCLPGPVSGIQCTLIKRRVLWRLNWVHAVCLGLSVACSADSDQTPCSAASNLGPHSLPGPVIGLQCRP